MSATQPAAGICHRAEPRLLRGQLTNLRALLVPSLLMTESPAHHHTPAADAIGHPSNDVSLCYHPSAVCSSSSWHFKFHSPPHQHSSCSCTITTTTAACPQPYHACACQRHSSAPFDSVTNNGGVNTNANNDDSPNSRPNYTPSASLALSFFSRRHPPHHSLSCD